MKTAVLGILLGLVVATLSLTGSCAINHKSDGYTCTTNNDCTGGRFCSGGFCVEGTAIDAPKGDAPKGDANGCPAPCTSCNTSQHTCTVDCSIANCTNTVTCPAGYKCDIQCKTDNSCRNGVNCQLGTSCSVECSGRQACQNIECGIGPCDISCTGVSSCRGINCNSSCACDVTCTANQSCADTIQCSSLACKSGSGCTSVPALCHSCN